MEASSLRLRAAPAALHQLTLSFKAPDLDRSFLEDYTQRSLPLVRLSLVLAAVLYLGYHFLDKLIIPEVVGPVLGIRLLVSALLIGAVALTFHPFFRAHFQPLMSLVVLIGGGGILWQIYIGQDVGGHEYYAGLMLAVIYAHALLRLRFIHATATTWGIIAAYALLVFGGGWPADEMLISHVAFLSTANILGMFSSYGLEYYARMVFLKTRQLEGEHTRKVAELEEARQLQLSMLPQRPPEHPRVELAVSMVPATEVGGDFYDFHVAEDGTLTFAIGDATGHGARAGAVVTATKILFQVLAREKDLAEALRRASGRLRDAHLPGMYMALAVGRIRSERLELVGAGLPPALLYRSVTGAIEEIPLKGLPIGFSAAVPYASTAITLEPGDTLALMTDGFPELRNGRRDMLGYEKMAAIFCQQAAEAPEQILSHLQETVKTWTEGHAQEDDITFLVLRLRPVQHTSPVQTKHGDGFSLEAGQDQP